MFGFGLSPLRPLDVAMICVTVLGTYYAGALSLILVMRPLRMSLFFLQFGAGRVLLVVPGRRVTVQWRVLPWNLAVLGMWRDVRSLAARIWIFRVSQLLAVLGWGALAGLVCTPGSRVQREVWLGTLIAACFLLTSRTRDKRFYIASVLYPRLKTDPQVVARAISVKYAHMRFGQGDDRPMRALAAAENPDALTVARIAYIEGRFADALAALDHQASLLAARNPDAAAKFRAAQAAHLAELALYAAEARQIPVTVGVPQANAAMAGTTLSPAHQALMAVLSGDPVTALPLARKARWQPNSRLDLADIYCTLAHVHGVLGDRAKAHELLDRARGLVPIYARPDHVAQRHESADPRVVSAS